MIITIKNNTFVLVFRLENWKVGSTLFWTAEIFNINLYSVHCTVQHIFYIKFTINILHFKDIFPNDIFPRVFYYEICPSRSARPPPLHLRRSKLTFGKVPLGKLHIWEIEPSWKVATWEIVSWEVTLGKMPLGKYLTPIYNIERVREGGGF